MAINLTSLTREWIQFLKNNQIVSTNSNPKSGRLKYNRQPNVQELIRFLKLKSDFDDETIRKAIKTVLKSSGQSADSGDSADVPTLPGQRKLPGPGPTNGVSTWQHTEMTPGQRPDAQDPVHPINPPVKRKYSNDDAEDIDYRDPSRPPKSLGHKKTRPGKGLAETNRLSEAFYDRQGAELSEVDIKKIFKYLLDPQPADEQPAPQPDEGKPADDKQDTIRKLKRIIRDTMSPAQRKSFWRIISDNTDDALNEEQINPADAKAIIKVAADFRNKPTGVGDRLKGLWKDKVDVNDLQAAWRDAGFPDDTRDLYAILKDHGYGQKEIRKIFAKVFGSDEESDTGYEKPVAGDLMQKMADLAIKAGIVDDIKEFMIKEFGEELGLTKSRRNWYGKKVVSEDVRDIFTLIIQEERTDRMMLIRQQEQRQLGRIRK